MLGGLAPVHVLDKADEETAARYPCLFDILSLPTTLANLETLHMSDLQGSLLETAGQPDGKEVKLGAQLEQAVGAVKEVLALRWACAFYGARSSHGHEPLRPVMQGMWDKFLQRRAGGKPPEESVS